MALCTALWVVSRMLKPGIPIMEPNVWDFQQLDLLMHATYGLLLPIGEYAQKGTQAKEANPGFSAMKLLLIKMLKLSGQTDLTA